MRGLYNRQYNKSTGFPKMEITLAVKGTHLHHQALSPDVVGGSTFISVSRLTHCTRPPTPTWARMGPPSPSVNSVAGLGRLSELTLHHIGQQQAASLGQQLGRVLVQDDDLHPLDVGLRAALLGQVAGHLPQHPNRTHGMARVLLQ